VLAECYFWRLFPIDRSRRRWWYFRDSNERCPRDFIIMFFVSVARRTRNVEKSSAWWRSPRLLITTIPLVHTSSDRILRILGVPTSAADCNGPDAKAMRRLNGIRLALGVGSHEQVRARATYESTPAYYKTRVVRLYSFALYRNLMIPRLPAYYVFSIPRNAQRPRGPLNDVVIHKIQIPVTH